MKSGEDQSYYEQHFGSASIFTLTFATGIATELVGTFLINVLGLCVCMLLSSKEHNVGVLSVGTAFGLAFLTVTTMLHGKGSCHFNPCVSFSSLFLGHVTLIWCFAAVLVQIVAATIAAVSLRVAFGDLWDAKAMTVSVPSDLTAISVFVCEFIGSLLILCSRSVPFENTMTRNYFVATATAIAVTVFIPYSGGALNPARAIGPSFSYRMSETIPPNFWVYWVGPIAASAVSACLLLCGVLHRGDLV